MRESFIFYKSWSDALAKLPNGVRLEVLDAVINYGFTGEEPQFASPVAEIAFSFIKTDIDRNTAKYEEKVERIRQQRSEAGKKGMAKRWGESITNITNDNKNNKDNNSDNKNNKCYFVNNKNNKHNTNDNVNVDMLSTRVDETLISVDNNMSSTNIDNPSLPLTRVNKTLISVSGSSGASPDALEQPKETVKIDGFIRFVNEEIDKAQSRIPHVKSVTGQRLAFLNARCAEFGKHAVMEAIQKAVRSRFLNGGGDRGFIADLTWVLRPNNFPRVLEGVFDNNNQSLNSNGINQGRFATKRDANEYALRKLVEARERYENGITDDSPKPF